MHVSTVSAPPVLRLVPFLLHGRDSQDSLTFFIDKWSMNESGRQLRRQSLYRMSSPLHILAEVAIFLMCLGKSFRITFFLVQY